MRLEPAFLPGVSRSGCWDAVCQCAWSYAEAREEGGRQPAWAGLPEQVPGDGGPVHGDAGGWQQHRVGHERAHDGVQELIAGIRVRLLLLLLEVC